MFKRWPFDGLLRFQMPRMALKVRDGRHGRVQQSNKTTVSFSSRVDETGHNQQPTTNMRKRGIAPVYAGRPNQPSGPSEIYGKKDGDHGSSSSAHDTRCNEFGLGEENLAHLPSVRGGLEVMYLSKCKMTSKFM